MNLTHPTIKKKIETLQVELKQLTKCDVKVMAIIQPVNKKVTYQEVVKVVCRATLVSYEDVLGGSRKTPIVLTRHLICYFSYLHTDFGLQCIADKLGLDHTSVMHAKKRINGSIEAGNSGVIWLVHQINEALNSANAKITASGEQDNMIRISIHQ